MSVSDPLLKSLKGLILELRFREDVVTDRNEKLVTLCETLEKIFRKGLKKSTGGWFSKSDYWAWLSKLSSYNSNQRINPILCMVIDEVKKSKRTLLIQGKGRLFIRSALFKRVLSVPVQLLAKDSQLAQTWYDYDKSILGNEILSEILQSLLFELTEVTFKFNLRNSSFLDTTWELPVYREYEFVPCEELGIQFVSVEGYHIVTSVLQGGVGEEDGKIKVGDVLDEMAGEVLRGAKQSAVQSLFHQNKSLPIHMCVIKLQDRSGSMYTPLKPLLQQANLNPEDLCGDVECNNGDRNEENRKPPHAILPEEEADEVPVHDSESSAQYEGRYLGKASLGRDGRVDRIEDAVLLVFSTCKDTKNVFIDLSEKDVVIRNRENKEVLMKHVFTEISACGRRTDALKHFAYISGETTCSLAEDFYCHVFEAKDDDQAKEILCTIAQGFERTHLLM